MVCGGRSQTLRRWLGILRRRGQSEVLGPIILLGIIVIAASIIGVFVFGSFGETDEQLLANLQGNVTTDGITLDHEGGDTFEPENVEVLLQGDTEASLTFDDDFNTSDGADTVAPGDTWQHTTDDFYAGEFRLVVVHEPTNSILLNQPQSLPITDVSLLVENWRGEYKDDRASVFGNGSEYNFTVQVNAGDGQPPRTVPMSPGSLAGSGGVVTLADDSETGLDVNVSLSDNEYGMVTMEDTDSETGVINASWNDSADDAISNPYEEVVLEATVDTDQFNSTEMILDDSDTTDVRVLRNKSLFTVDFTPGSPSATDEGDVLTTYNVTNVGLQPNAVNVTVTYENDTDVLYSYTAETTTIGPGNSTSSTPEAFNFRNDDGVYEDINVTLSVPTDDAKDNVTLDAPDFQVNVTDAPSAAPTDTELSVDAEVTNDGGVVDTQEISLDTNGSNTDDTESVELSPGESTLVENLTVDAPTSPGTVTLNVSSEQNYDTAEVEVQNVLIPIQTYGEWDLVGDFFTGNAGSNTGASGPSSTERSEPTVGTQRGTGDVGTQNSELDASGENIAVVSPKGGTSPGRSVRVDELLHDIIDARTNADTVDLMRPSVNNFTNDMDEYNTFVVYRFAEDDILAPPKAKTFTEELNDTQGVVYTSTNTGFTQYDYANAVDTIYDIRSDPSGYGEEPDGTRGTPIEITKSHPIWSGIGDSGDQFETVDFDQSDTGVEYSAYFSGYSGEVLGDDVDSGDGAVGVDETPDNGSTEVLLTNAVPYQTIVEEDSVKLTEDAKTLLANAVKYAAASNGGGDPNFAVQAVSHNGPVDAGDDLNVDVTVKNTGAVSDTQTVRLDVTNPGGNFKEEDSTTLALNPGEEETQTLTYSTTGGDAPDVDIKVVTDNSSLSVTGIQVNSPGGGGSTDITYSVDQSRNSVALPDPATSPGSGKFSFTTGSSKASEAVVWEDYLDGENWIRFEYSSTDLDEGIETNVSIDGDTRWASSADTGGNWETRLVDVAGAGDDTPVGFGLRIPSGASNCNSPCSLYYDNVTFVNHSLPLQTADDWVQTGGTLDGSTMGFDTDSSESTTSGVSGQFDGSGTGSVAVRESLTGGDWLTFDYLSSSGSFDSLTVVTDGTDELTVNSVTGGWESESVFLEDTGNTKIEFELSCSSTCQFNLDNVRLEPPAPSIPLKTRQHWSEVRPTFESTDAAEMGFEVNESISNVSDASGRFTAGEFANGVAQVAVTEDLTDKEAISFDYRGEDLGIAQVSAAVTVDNDTLFTSSGNPGGWTTERIDVSDYTGTNEITFEMRVGTETLNEEEIFFDNVSFVGLPDCTLDSGSYDSGTSDFELVSGDLSTCALESDDDIGTDSLLSSTGLNDPGWFEPPETEDYPGRSGRISYSVKAASGTTAKFLFGDDPSSARYGVWWSPDTENLTLAVDGTVRSFKKGGNDGTDEYYRIIVDWDFDSSLGNTGVIYARAVNGSGDTVAHTGINDLSYDGSNDPGAGIGFDAEGPGSVVWDNLDYGATNFEKVLPQPGESYYANGQEWSTGGPTGLAHDGGWIHDRLPVEEGETRTYNYYVNIGTGLSVALRNGTATETESPSDIENAVHLFPDQFDFRDIRTGPEDEVMVSLTIDYTDESEVEMRVAATREDGGTDQLVQTWSGASNHDEIYVSTFENGQPRDAYRDDSLRLVTERTGQSAAAGYPYDADVHPFAAVAGYGHSGAWVDQNGPTTPGTIERIPYFAPVGSSVTNELTVQLRDKPASDQGRAFDKGPSDEFGKYVDNFLEVERDSYTVLILDYSVAGEVFLRATSLKGPGGDVVGTAVVPIPDSAPEDLPVYLSTHEDGSPDPWDSVRYSPFG